MRQSDLSGRIRGMLADQPGLLLEQLINRCPDATWNQVFTVVDRLSRTGDIRLTAKGSGSYRVELHAAEHQTDIHGALSTSSTIPTPLHAAGRAENRDEGATTMMRRMQSEFAWATGQHICPRCNGLMVPGCTDGLRPEILNESRLLSWHCVNCGEWIDPTVLANRRAGQEETVAVTRPRCWS